MSVSLSKSLKRSPRVGSFLFSFEMYKEKKRKKKNESTWPRYEANVACEANVVLWVQTTCPFEWRCKHPSGSKDVQLTTMSGKRRRRQNAGSPTSIPHYRTTYTAKRSGEISSSVAGRLRRNFRSSVPFAKGLWLSFSNADAPLLPFQSLYTGVYLILALYPHLQSTDSGGTTLAVCFRGGAWSMGPRR